MNDREMLFEKLSHVLFIKLDEAGVVVRVSQGVLSLLGRNPVGGTFSELQSGGMRVDPFAEEATFCTSFQDSLGGHSRVEFTKIPAESGVALLGAHVMLTHSHLLEEKAKLENELTLANRRLQATVYRLEQARSHVKTLSGMLPICANCKSIRNDKGYWSKVEQYISDNSEITFSHGICPDCVRELYPDMVDILDEE